MQNAAEGYRDMVKFLRDLVKIPGESAEEGNKIARAKAEMEKLGFDKIDIDPRIYLVIWGLVKINCF